jgi:hypothetical protein
MERDIGKERQMKKNIQYIIVTILLLACSGCFPVFVPTEGGGHGGGEHEHHEQGEHGGHGH